VLLVEGYELLLFFVVSVAAKQEGRGKLLFLNFNLSKICCCQKFFLENTILENTMLELHLSPDFFKTQDAAVCNGEEKRPMCGLENRCVI